MATYAGFKLSAAFDGNDPTAIRNLEATLDALEGRDPRELFGPDVELDRLKITHWSPDTCGCVVDFIWHRDQAEDERVHHPHRSHKVCKRHAHLANDREGHHLEVLEHNRHKNHAVGLAAELVGAGPTDVTWSFDEDGTLALGHPKLTPARLKKIESHPSVKGRKVRAA